MAAHQPATAATVRFSVIRAWLCAVALAASAALLGCTEEPSAPSPPSADQPEQELASGDISLLDRWPDAQIHSDQLAYHRKPLPQRTIARVGNARKSAILCSHDTQIVYQNLELPEQPLLQFYYGLLLAGRPVQESVRFRVIVTADNADPQTVFEDELSIGKREGLQWQWQQIDLAAYAGGPVDVALKTSFPGEPGAGPLRPNWLPVWGLPAIRSEEVRGGESIILISLDGVRADALAHMPQLAELADQGIHFRHAYAPSPWSQPSTMALLSGRRPRQLGFTDSYLDLPDRDAPVERYAQLTVLPELLRQEGRQTAAITGGGFMDSNYMMHGFDSFASLPLARRQAYHIAQAANEWLTHHHTRPFFLFLQTYQARAPYQTRDWQGEPTGRVGPTWGEAWHLRYAKRAPETDPLNQLPERATWYDDPPDYTAAERAAIEKLYAEDLQEADRLIGEVRAALDRLALNDRVTLIVLSSHGQEFWEHGLTLHGHTLYNELLHVPLVIRQPRPENGPAVEQTVSLLDVAPTILRMINRQPPDAMDGDPLQPLFDGTGKSRTIRAEAPFIGPNRVSLQHDGWKLILSAPDADAPNNAIPRFPVELFNLRDDPAEQQNLAGDAEHDARLEQMRRQLHLAPPAD